MKTILKSTFAGLLAAAMAGLPLSIAAQTNDQPAATTNAVAAKKAATPRKSGSGPFRAKLVAVDKLAKTITVGTRTFQITSDTKIFKGGKPATLDDGVIGELATGYAKAAGAGQFTVTRLSFGPSATAKKPAPAAEKAAETPKQ